MSIVDSLKDYSLLVFKPFAMLSKNEQQRFFYLSYLKRSKENLESSLSSITGPESESIRISINKITEKIESINAAGELEKAQQKQDMHLSRSMFSTDYNGIIPTIIPIPIKDDSFVVNSGIIADGSINYKEIEDDFPIIQGSDNIGVDVALREYLSIKPKHKNYIVTLHFILYENSSNIEALDQLISLIFNGQALYDQYYNLGGNLDFANINPSNSARGEIDKILTAKVSFFSKNYSCLDGLLTGYSYERDNINSGAYNLSLTISLDGASAKHAKRRLSEQSILYNLNN